MKQSFLKLISLLLATLICILTLVGCSEKNNDGESNTDAIAIETYKAQIDYYSSLVNDLQDQLLKEKEESYITECEYKLRLESLENDIERLTKKLGYISAGLPDVQEKEFDAQSKENGNLLFDELSNESSFGYTESDGRITITSYKGEGGIVSIPSFINNLPVTAIGDNAFENAAVTSVIIPDGVESIGWFAFSGCLALKDITIPPTVTSIGYETFSLCPSALTIKCESGSYAEAYALSWGISVE